MTKIPPTPPRWQIATAASLRVTKDKVGDTSVCRLFSTKKSSWARTFRRVIWIDSLSNKKSILRMNIGLFDAGHVHLVSFFLEPCADLLWFAPKPCAVESYVLQGLLNGPLCSWHWTVGEEFLKSHNQVHKQGMFTFFLFFFGIFLNTI